MTLTRTKNQIQGETFQVKGITLARSCPSQLTTFPQTSPEG